MEYVKGVPYFCQTEEKIKKYPYLNKDVTTDILIIGGGIDGAILNYHLSQQYDCILVDKSRFGKSCTSCATVLLEYQLDSFADDLGGEMSKKDILNVYRMGLASIEKLETIINKLGNHCHFSKRPSFLYTTRFQDVAKIELEFTFRKENGLNAHLYDKDSNPFPFAIKSGLYCEDGGAEFNSYLFTKQMIENANNQRNIYENTLIEYLAKLEDNYIAYTNFGEKITANKIIYATGYNWELMNNVPLCDKFITYSIVTNPIKGLMWQDNALMQDVMEPYHYFRLLPDGRLIWGGEDTVYSEGCIEEKKTNKKYDKLMKDLCKLLPQYADSITADYKFCGMFAQTDNNLGLIGRGEEDNIYYFLSCGANGIINALYGVDLIEDLMENRKNSLEKQFAPLRYCK